MSISNDDFAPVAGGRQLTPDQLRADLDTVGDLVAKSDLDLHLVRLLTLHPNVKLRFQSPNLSKLDDATKRSLIEDINDALGIKPLRSRAE